MKLGFSLLSLFMKDVHEMLEIATDNGFDSVELLAEGPYRPDYLLNNKEAIESFASFDLDIYMHAVNVDINLASINNGIRLESVKQTKDCLDLANEIGAIAITSHPGVVGRREDRIRNMALAFLKESVVDIMDHADTMEPKFCVENMPKRFSYLGNRAYELENLVKESFLKEYPVEVQYNKVDTNIFKPTPGDFRERYGLAGKKIVLGVSNGWDRYKGLDDFVALAKLLDDRFRVVLVGMDPKQIRELAPGILGLPRTHNAAELAEIYTAADVFVNPSREETFGLTSYEASLCGTPVIVYRGTACEEIAKLYNGLAVDPNAQAICEAIQQFI